MVEFLPHDSILALGKQLVAELGLDRSCDTLARWMAHHIADLIHAAESAGDEERPAAMDRCARAILDLWNHRHVLPDGSRPFEAAEPLFRAIRSLDPDSIHSRWFREVREAATDAGTDGEVAAQWLEFTARIDESARILICWGLANAADAAVDQTRKWVSLAEAAEIDGDIDIQVLRFIVNEHDLQIGNSGQSDESARLKGRLERLEMFCNAANDLAQTFRGTAASASGGNLPLMSD